MKQVRCRCTDSIEEKMKFWGVRTVTKGRYSIGIKRAYIECVRCGEIWQSSAAYIHSLRSVEKIKGGT
jgi:hypothetical protein